MSLIEKKLGTKRYNRFIAEIKLMLHASRDAMRNRGEDTVNSRFDINDPYYAEAFGLIRAAHIMTGIKYGSVGEFGSLNGWMRDIKDEVLKEENFLKSGHCSHCYAIYGKDSARKYNVNHIKHKHLHKANCFICKTVAES